MGRKWYQRIFLWFWTGELSVLHFFPICCVFFWTVCSIKKKKKKHIQYHFGFLCFSSLLQQLNRPKKCEATVCKCVKGRKYLVDSETSANSLVYCNDCGSHAAHLGCIKGVAYLCEECAEFATKSDQNSASGEDEANSSESAQSLDDAPHAFKIEYAKSNRCLCRGCMKKIGKETLRIGPIVPVCLVLIV